MPGNDSNSSSSSPGNSLESCGENTRAFGLEGQSTSEMVGQAGELEPLLWECVIDVRGLTALPPRTKLSQLWALPADCLLLEMSNEALYAPGTYVINPLAYVSEMVPRPADDKYVHFAEP